MIRPLTVAAAAALLAGCASFSEDGGFEKVERLTRERVGVAPVWQRSQNPSEAAQTRVAELLAQPLTADSAVELALLNNRRLQASFHALGIAEADVVRAGRLANPFFGFSRLSGAGRIEIERSLGFNLLGLITMPLARQVEERRFEAAQLQAASEAVGLAAETRRAYFKAVAAQELGSYFQQVREAADASRDLAGRMAAAGNFSRLAHLREQAFYADASASLARAQHQAFTEREQLVRRLGLGAIEDALKLPQRLPELPGQPATPKDAEQTAVDTRLDIMAARLSTRSLADSLGLSKATRMVNVLHAGYANFSESGEPRRDGYEIELELPLFDFGSSRIARAEAVYLQALNQTAQTTIDARSEVRQSYSAYRTAYDLARHYRDEVVPLRKRISEENLVRYNGMLISVFELLADARAQISGVTGYVEALRDYWIADTNLQTALLGRSPGSSAGSPAALATAAGNAANY